MEGESEKQAQFLLLLNFLEDEEKQLPQKKFQVEERVNVSDLVEDNTFMQRAQAFQLPPPLPSSSTSTSSRRSERNLLKRAKEFLFDDPYKIGRVFTLSGSISGTGWISSPPYVVTCAHIVHTAGSEPLYFQLPNDSTFVLLNSLFVRREADYQVDYRKDVAFLEMKSIKNSTSPISTLPVAGIDAGQLDWTCQCVTAGMLAPFSSSSPHESQKMLNPGSVESISRSLATTNARADKGFSGGPILNKDLHIIGMVQGGHGELIKTVRMIPIDQISDMSCILSQVLPIPPISIPMNVSGSSMPF